MARETSLMLSADQKGKGSGIRTVQVVHARAEKMLPAEKESFVAIPLLPVRAATPGEKGDRVADLDQLKPEGMLAVPNWKNSGGMEP